MKHRNTLLVVLLAAVLLCGCIYTEEESVQTTLGIKEPAQATEPRQEEETDPPTEPPAEVAREMIREGAYQEALEILEDVECDEAEMLRIRAELGNVEVGDEILFGRYEQDTDRQNGMEDIQWIVIDKKGNKVLLLSVCCLDTQPYHNENKPVTWERSYLRSWLNDVFCNTAFTAPEQMMLAETELLNQNNPLYGISGGANTVDRVFLLSVDDVDTYLSQPQRKAQVTAYADSRDCYSTRSGYAYWWLRTPGRHRSNVVDVDPNGEYNLDGVKVDYRQRGVRPAVWLDLNL